MRRRVLLVDEYGDTIHAVERWSTQSDLPNTFTVNGRCMFTNVWAERGWAFHSALEEWEF